MRLASTVASVAALYFAYRLGVLLSFHWSAHVLVLGYLATDHLQIFFGMAGMETQVAVAIFLGTIYFLLSKQWWQLGISLGLGLICRPEFAAVIAGVGVVMLLYEREKILLTALVALAVGAPWIMFARIYYGSPIPNTIIAKQVLSQAGFSGCRTRRRSETI